MTLKLPIDKYLNSIADGLRSTNHIVLRAEPGAGKTTRLPSFLINQFPCKIYVLEPRRLAAKLAAMRVAEETGLELGRDVGYILRHEKRCDQNTRLIFVTEGVFLRILLDQEEIKNISCVVLDEFHERNINTDLSLAFLKYLETRGHFTGKIIVMSATIDIQIMESYFGDIRYFDLPGRSFPLIVEYMSKRQSEEHPKLEEIKHAVVRMNNDKRCSGNILVFLPGVGPIQRLRSMLKAEPVLNDVDILTLTAEVSTNEQERIFKKSERRKIILSTNVAETSVTIPGVSGVVDSGLAKISRFAPWSGLATLDTRRVSRAACEQRAGRAGREQNGLVYRVFSEADFLRREPYTLPEIKRSDLAKVVLDVLSFLDRWNGDLSGFTIIRIAAKYSQTQRQEQPRPMIIHKSSYISNWFQNNILVGFVCFF